MLTVTQWLNSQGGRTVEDDLLFDTKGKLYVLMRDGRGGNEIVYLPEYLIFYENYNRKI